MIVFQANDAVTLLDLIWLKKKKFFFVFFFVCVLGEQSLKYKINTGLVWNEKGMCVTFCVGSK